MRAPLGALLLLLGCPNPDEGFRLSGRVVDQSGRPVPGHEVRVLRDASPDADRCTPMEPFTSLTTDARGAFQTTVFRYQLGLGSPVPRYFRVETHSPAEPDWTSAYVFRFAPVDVALPDLFVRTGSGFELPRGYADSFFEAMLDGTLAWRGGQPPAAEERPMAVRRVERLTRDDFVDANLLGYDSQWVTLEARLERPQADLLPGPVSRLRGARCDIVPGDRPCPLTDGRMLPVRLPPGTRSVVITTPEVLLASTFVVRGLQVSGAVERVLLEAGTDDDGTVSWRAIAPVPRAKELLEYSRGHCLEPGAFLTISNVPSVFQALRLRAEDAEGRALELTALSEVSAP